MMSEQSKPAQIQQQLTPFQQRQFFDFVQQRARPILLFVYWAGGVIAFSYLIHAWLTNIDALVLPIRLAYLSFWAVLTYATFYASSPIDYGRSFILYSIGGTIFTTYIYGVVQSDLVFFVTSLLLYLIGLVIAQLQAKYMAWVALVSIVCPVLVLVAFDMLGQAQMNALFVVLIWAVCCWVVARVFENNGVRLFKYEQDLKASRDREKQANNAKSRFLAVMSHEIRTPLTAIIGYADAIHTDIHANDTSRQAGQIIQRNGRQLLTLINDILDVSKMTADKLETHTRPALLMPILREVEGLMAGLSDEKDIALTFTFDFPLPNIIQVDPVRLRQILINLIGNGIKFTDQGEVKLHVYIDQSQLRFRVTDTGIGLNAEDANRLFAQFAQLDNSDSRTHGGTGLGLYLSRQLAHQMQGDVVWLDKPGAGSCFELSLPFTANAETQWLEAYPKEPVGVVVSKKQPRLSGKVLLAEDFEDNRLLISAMLTSFGLQVDTATNGEVAVEKALKNDYDLLLMDIQMPVMDGLEALSWLKQANNLTPVIAVTANVSEEDIQAYQQAGFAGHVQKPLEAGVLYQVLASHLNKQGAAQEPQIDAELMAALSEKFKLTLSHLLNDFRGALERLDWDESSRICHRIQGSVGHFGLTALTPMVEELADAIQHKDDSHALTCLQRLLQTLVKQ